MTRCQQLLALLSAALVLFHLAGCSCNSGSGENPPSELSYSQNPALYALGVAITANVPTVTGNVSSWTVTPVLPAGLTLDSVTGVISGIPTALAQPESYTVEGANSTGSTTAELTLAVLEIDPPSGLSYSPSSPYAQGVAIAPITPTVDGIVFEYALEEGSPALPLGLELDATTGAISGTPLLRSPAVTVSVVASNPAGHTTAGVPLAIAARAVRFSYVVNQSDNTLGAYALDSSTGQLTGRGYAVTGENPQAVAVSPLGTAAYVANYFDGNLSVYFADITSGALSWIQNVTAGVGPRDIEVTPDGRWIYALNGLSGDVSRYQLDEGTGGLTPILPRISLGGPAQEMVLDPTGRYLFVAINPALVIAVYAVDTETGGLSLVQNAQMSELVRDVVIDPSGRFLYVPSGSYNVYGYAIDDETGALTTIAGGPWSVGAGSPFPLSAVVSADGAHLYTSNNQANNVSQFAIDAETGALSPMDPLTVPAPTGPWAIAMGGQDEYLFVTTAGSTEIRAFDVDADGLLSPNQVAPVVLSGVGPIDLACLRATSPLGSRTDFVYASNLGSNDVAGFSAASGSSGNGDLTTIAGSPFASGLNPVTVSVHPSNKFLYTADSAPGSISLFTIDSATGALTAGTGIGAGSHSDVLLEPSGRFAYGVLPSLGESLVWPYAIDQASGELTVNGVYWVESGELATGAEHPTGRFLYFANVGGDRISALAISPVTGRVSSVPSGSAFGSPRAVAVHPTGGWLYAPMQSVTAVLQYRVDALSGQPIPLTPASEPFPTPGGDGQDVAIHPGGEFLYVANGVNNEVLLFSVDRSTGLLTGVGGTAVPAAARGVMVDASGRFVYVTTDGNQVVKFLVNAADGTLSSSSTATAGTNPQGLAGTRNDF